MTSLQIKITSDIFEAELKCPMKCWLRNAGEPFSGVAYTQWRQTKNLSYCGTATGLLASQSSSDEFALSPSIRDFESAKWSKASSVSVQAKTDKYMLESNFAQKDAKHGTLQGYITLQVIAQTFGYRQHPLAHWQLGEDVVSQMRGCFDHAPCVA